MRLQALMRCADPAAAVPLRVADLVLDPARREVRRGDREIAVTNRESELLETTATSPRDATRRRPPEPWRFEGVWQPSGARG